MLRFLQVAVEGGAGLRLLCLLRLQGLRLQLPLEALMLVRLHAHAILLLALPQRRGGPAVAVAAPLVAALVAARASRGSVAAAVRPR